MDIFDLDRALIGRYEAFARSFSEIHAPEIRAQVDAAYAEQRFWPEPLITINPRFEGGASIDELVAQEVLDPALRRIFATGPDRHRSSSIATKNEPSPKSATAKALL